jgi:putative ABC transport system substrate-binding protein
LKLRSDVGIEKQVISLTPMQRRLSDEDNSKSVPVSLCLILLLLSGMIPVSGVSRAERHRPIRIGTLTDSWGPTPQVVGLRDGLAALGYHENEDFFLGVRFTQGDMTALSAAAHDLLQLGVDLIFTTGDPATRAAQQATDRIPIVFSGSLDPVAMRFIKSFAQPGGNITGVADLALKLGPKRLQVFSELVPNLRRVVVPYDANNSFSVMALRTLRGAAHRLDITLIERAVASRQAARELLAELSKDEVDGILAPNYLSLDLPGVVMETAAKNGIPAIFDGTFYVEHGALASYGQDFYHSGRLAARLVDQIIKGKNPAGIPVEVNPQIVFAINLKTARALGLDIAPQVLYQADKIVR